MSGRLSHEALRTYETANERKGRLYLTETLYTVQG
jgi:hypothetical protein